MKKYNNGFTLIELMIVIFIGVVLLVMSIRGTRDLLDTQKTSTAIQTLVSSLRLGKALAMELNAPTKVVVSSSNIIVQSKTSQKLFDYSKSSNFGSVLELPKGVSVDAANTNAIGNAFYFNSFGLSDSSNGAILSQPVYITLLVGSHKQKLTVTNMGDILVSPMQ